VGRSQRVSERAIGKRDIQSRFLVGFDGAMGGEEEDSKSSAGPRHWLEWKAGDPRTRADYGKILDICTKIGK